MKKNWITLVSLCVVLRVCVCVCVCVCVGGGGGGGGGAMDDTEQLNGSLFMHSMIEM